VEGVGASYSSALYLTCTHEHGTDTHVTGSQHRDQHAHCDVLWSAHVVGVLGPGAAHADAHIAAVVGSPGPGNWAAVAEHVGTKSTEECQQHYYQIYIQPDSFPLPTPAPEMAGVSAGVLLCWCWLSDAGAPSQASANVCPCLHSLSTLQQLGHCVVQMVMWGQAL
jgi:hypothetical protein